VYFEISLPHLGHRKFREKANQYDKEENILHNAVDIM
jgi:hypothetical protein